MAGLFGEEDEVGGAQRGSASARDPVERAQSELRALLQERRRVHVTELAAACLRAVDAAALNAVMGDPDVCETFRGIRDSAQRILRAAEQAGDVPGNVVDQDTLRELGALLDALLARDPADDDVRSAYPSIGARALAQALHDTREIHFWSYFSAFTEPKQLFPGDPFPVPSSPKLHEIYPPPLRPSPCPDSRDAPQTLCPGGYRGLPSLRLAPSCADADLYLDPALGYEICPLLTSDAGSGKIALVIPAPDLHARYEYHSWTVGHERVFGDVRPRDAAGGVPGLTADVIADLFRAASHVALAVLPELTSTTELEHAIGAALAGGQLGCMQLVVAGSSWIPTAGPKSPGDNRSTSFVRGGEPHRHYKFSWFRAPVPGAERLVRRRKRITVLAGPRLTFTTLICKDALETWVPAVLQALRVRLVVVPTCNAGVAAFRPFATAVSDLGWGTVVLANIPPDAESPSEYGLMVRPAAVRVLGKTGHVSEVPVPNMFNSLILFNIR